MIHLNLKIGIISFFLMSFTGVNAQTTDKFDGVPSGTRLIKDLKDIYNAYQINHRIAEQKENINLLADDGSAGDLRKTLILDVKSCDSLNLVHFFNDTLNKQVKKYLAATIRNYNIALKYGLQSLTFKNDYKDYQKESDKYWGYLSKSYSMQRFVNLTEDEYWKLNEKNNYIKSTDYKKYTELKKKDPGEAQAVLKKIIDETKDFQEYTIYKIEYADQLTKKDDAKAAIKNYKEILDKHTYSIYLFEAWVKWRAVLQHTNYGLSKTSEIPNGLYDDVRAQTALTILEEVNRNPKNRMAINEFLLMATHDIIKRFGSYPYGNQSTIEYHELFDDEGKN